MGFNGGMWFLSFLTCDFSIQINSTQIFSDFYTNLISKFWAVYFNETTQLQNLYL